MSITERKPFMNRVTATILSLALAASAGWAADPPETPKKSEAELLYEKLLAENTKEADKQYGEYLAALAKANDAILKKLEATKADLNDTKKFKNLDIAARAKAIAEIDAKILEVKKNGVGEAIVAARNADLLDGGKVDVAKAIVGKWGRDDGVSYWQFNNDGSGVFFFNKITYTVSWKWNEERNEYDVEFVGSGNISRTLKVNKYQKTAIETCKGVSLNLSYIKIK